MCSPIILNQINICNYILVCKSYITVPCLCFLLNSASYQNEKYILSKNWCQTMCIFPYVDNNTNS